jgi:UDP-2,3-diacylglucosamine hydrolase
VPGILRKVKPGNRLRAATEAAIFGAVLGQRLLIVSDAHLGRGTSETEEAFLAFLAAAPSLGDCLLINGDLFEFWFTYKRVVPRTGFRVAASLAELRRRIPVVMTGGNHDRWGGTFWQKELGIEFSPSEVRLGVGRRVVLALHGDGVTETRPSARWLHRLTRHPLAIAGFRSLHPDVGHWLVDHLSASLGNSEPDPAAQADAARQQQRWARHASKAIRVLGRSSSDTLTGRCFQSLSRDVTISIREHGLMDTAMLSSATSAPN